MRRGGMTAARQNKVRRSVLRFQPRHEVPEPSARVRRGLEHQEDVRGVKGLPGPVGQHTTWVICANGGCFDVGIGGRG